MNEFRQIWDRLTSHFGFLLALLVVFIAGVMSIAWFIAKVCVRVLIYFFSLALTFYIFDIFEVNLLRDLLIFMIK